MERKIRKTQIVAFALMLALAALLFCACSGDGGSRISEITSLKYDLESDSVVIKATLDSSDIREFRGETVYLIEVPANNSVADITTLIPIAQTKCAGEMSFSVPLKNGAVTSLYSSFVLSVFDRTNGYIPLCDAKYIENPSTLAKNKSDYPEYSSIKGLNIVSSSEAVSLGVKHTVIRVPIEDYMSTSGEGSVTYIFDGSSYYYNSKKVSELDYKIKTLTGAGIEIFLEFTLNTAPSELPKALSSLGTYSGTAKENGHYAISVSSGESYRYMAAFFEFLAERYTRSDAKYGFAASYILGRGVNSLTETGIDDAMTLADKAESYAKLLRVAQTALRSRYKNGKVFVSLNNLWKAEEESGSKEAALNPAAPVSKRETFGVKEFLSALYDAVKTGGEFEYGFAVIPNSPDGSSSVWSDAGTGDKYITVRNLSLIRESIGDGELIIYNYEIGSDNEPAMAASYAYAYMMAKEAGVSAFIYGSQLDGDTGDGKSGLMYINEDGSLSKREIYSVFKGIDVKGGKEPQSAKALIGAEWSTIWEKNGEDIKSRYVGESIGSTVKDENNKALRRAESKVLFDFTKGKSYDFYPSDSAAYVEITELLGEKALKSGLYPKYKGERAGVRSAPISYDKLKGVLQIEAVISADGGEGNTANIELALVQSNANGSSIHVSKATVQSSNRQRVYFDISEAEIDEKFGDITLYMWVENGTGTSLYYEGDKDAKELTLYIESITAHIGKSNKGIVITVIIITAVLIIGALVTLYLKGRAVPQNICRGHGRQYNNRGIREGGRPRQVRPEARQGNGQYRAGPHSRQGQMRSGRGVPVGPKGQTRDTRNVPRAPHTQTGRPENSNNRYR
ncbi:MAG: DUF5722 domain-containing protein [Clostridia bacterium]|nr:DUF5722 domain-containing protein [Clostridia bacterium]